MQSILLKDPSSRSTAKIAAHLGFNCHQFHAHFGGKTVDVIDAAPDFEAGKQRPSGHGIPILFPFPNRIRAGKFSWKGREYHLPESKVGYDGAGNVIHGFAIDRPWRVIEQEESYAVGEFRLSIDAPERLDLWPADYIIRIRYEVAGRALRADIEIENPSDAPLPWGFGTHPYFKLPLGADSGAGQCLIEAPASEEWDLVNCLPTGKRRAVRPDRDLREGAYFCDLKLDDVFTGLAPAEHHLECYILDGKAGLQISQRCDPIFRELVIYTPPNRDAICLEPYTSLTDAINLEQQGIDAGLRVLEPGGKFKTWIEIEAGPIVA
jgi:aldose 1-epimerase